MPFSHVTGRATYLGRPLSGHQAATAGSTGGNAVDADSPPLALGVVKATLSFSGVRP